MNTFRVSDKYDSKSDAHMKRRMCAVDEPSSQLQCRSLAHYPHSYVGIFSERWFTVSPTPATRLAVSHLPKWTYTWQLEAGLPRRRGLLWKYFIPQFYLIFFSWGITSLAFIQFLVVHSAQMEILLEMYLEFVFHWSKTAQTFLTSHLIPRLINI